ncbi:hypothetical protein BX666DRAFT_1955158 [Dichotomocladium elegans]|nr:hypothetical protein BX666DRAFT_1955158 [Dichotomocladium elegans]
MLNKGAFKPKDARVINTYEDDDEDELDDWSLTTTSDLTPRPRRKKTGTQALAEFLSTTSPEEFQKTIPPKRGSNLFFRRRKNKPPSSQRQPPTSPTYRTYAPNTVHRINHIEIVPSETYSNTALARIASRAPSLASLIRPNNTQEKQPGKPEPQQQQQQQQQQQVGGAPILPSNRSIKHRESSIFNETVRHSIRSQISINNTTNGGGTIRGRPLMRHDTGTSVSIVRRMSEHTFGGGSTPHDDYHPHNPHSINYDTVNQLEYRNRRATESLVEHLATNQEQDTIEKALIQRLERFELAKMDKPSDTVAAGLATEHIKALEASSRTDPDAQQQKTKRKARHVQVQTMPLPPFAPFACESSSSPGPTQQQEARLSSVACGEDNDNDDDDDEHLIVTADNELSLIENLQQQLAEERYQRKRLQAALDETCDHFEVLSGLAYKKLRELWEERNHWENACIDLRERLLSAIPSQQPVPEDIMSTFPESTYGLEK